MAKRVLSVEEAMLLPDNCFGRIWPIGVCLDPGSGVTQYAIADLAFPERMVVWEWLVNWRHATTGVVAIRMALGDQLPATAAEFNALQVFMPGVGRSVAGSYYHYTQDVGAFALRRLRIPIMTSGQRLVCEATNVGAGVGDTTVTLVVSSIPTEVPDWLH